MSFVAARTRQYRQQYRPRLGLGPIDLGPASGGSDGNGSSISSIIGNIGKVASGIFSSASAAKAPQQTLPANVGPLAGVSTGTIVGIGFGFSALILVLASMGRGR